MILGFGIA